MFDSWLITGACPNLNTQVSYPPRNPCFQGDLNKFKNKTKQQEIQIILELPALAPHYSLVQCAPVISGFSAPQGLKDAVSAHGPLLRQLSQPQLQADFSAFKRSCHFHLSLWGGDLYTV